jgi:hypothetical protein
MALSISALDTVYKLYGFESRKIGPDLRAYLIRRGYYHNADIVVLSSNATEEMIALEKKNFEDAGYACSIRRYATTTDASNALFQGFFEIDATKARLSSKYSAFANSQSQSLGATYEYIAGPYGGDGEEPTASIVEAITEALTAKGARLVVLEAAAGYGKTCTAYEVLLRLTQRGHTPIFTELSRNRQAAIFRYVLLDEIDRHYPGLHSSLVEGEIRSGKLPLLVDGFDELLRSEAASSRKEFEDAETMLDTISALLSQNAKVLLTTRRTALFAGDEFSEWTLAKQRQFDVRRFVLREPSVSDWLGHERSEALAKADVPIAQLSNPVLLAFIRTLPDTLFNECCTRVETLIQHYFRALLEREQARQALRIDFATQLQIFQRLASAMIQLDFRAESRDFVGQIIAETSASDLEHARRLYPQAERPTLMQLAETLAGHALLDRAAGTDSKVGFINDFVAGLMMGDAICAEQGNWLGSDSHIDLSTTAYAVRDDAHRRALSAKLDYAMGALTAQEQLQVELRLSGGPSRRYIDATFDSLTFRSCKLGGNGSFERCTFVRCTFYGCAFELADLPAVGFVECRFFTCECSAASDVAGGIRWEAGCTSDDENLLSMLTATKEPSASAHIDTDLEIEVLRQFWPVGRPNAKTELLVRTLYSGMPNSEYEKLAVAIDKLRRSNLIAISGPFAVLNTARMGEIRSRLGRLGSKDE